jgi:hypothetical protein
MKPITKKQLEILLEQEYFPIKFQSFDVVELMGVKEPTFALISKQPKGKFMFMYSSDINAPLIFSTEADCKKVLKHYRKINKSYFYINETHTNSNLD